MNITLKNTILAAAAACFLSPLAMAGEILNIGFPFMAGKQAMPAGRYEIKKVTPVSFQLTHSKTGEAAFVSAPVPVKVADDGTGSVTFRCYSEGCAVYEVKLAYSEVSYRIKTRDLAVSAEPATLAVVRTGRPPPLSLPVYSLLLLPRRPISLTGEVRRRAFWENPTVREQPCENRSFAPFSHASS